MHEILWQREEEKHGYGWVEPFVLFRNTLFSGRGHPSGGCQVLMKHVIASEVHVGKKGKGERTYVCTTMINSGSRKRKKKTIVDPNSSSI